MANSYVLTSAQHYQKPEALKETDASHVFQAQALVPARVAMTVAILTLARLTCDAQRGTGGLPEDTKGSCHCYWADRHECALTM